jgi:hypothetical protein
MDSELSPEPGTQTVDLTGLPEPVVEDIKRLVQTLREKMPSPPCTPPTAGRRPLMGRFADLNRSIPRGHIDEAQREAWANLPRDLPGPPKSS